MAAPIPGTRIFIDAFVSETDAIFILTHFHADHKENIESRVGPIYCSPTTAKFLKQIDGIEAEVTQRFTGLKENRSDYGF